MLKCMECGTRLSIRPMSGSAPDSKLHVAGNRTAEASEASTATIARPTLDRVHKGCPVSTEAPLERPKLAGQRSGSSEPEVAVPREPSVAVNSESSRICECPCGARFRFPPHMAGMKRRCRKCQQPLLLPEDDHHADVAVATVAVDSRTLLQGAVKVAVARIADGINNNRNHLGKTLSSKKLNEFISQLESRDASSQSDAERRRLAVLKIGKSRDQRGLELIDSLRHDPSEMVRQAVATAVGELGDPRGVQVALELLCDHNAAVIRESVKSLRSLADPHSIRPLMFLGLNDGIQRAQVRETLVHIGSSGLSALLSIVEERSPLTIGDAVKVLGRIGDKRAVPSLLMALEHADSRLRREILEALGLLGDRSALGKIIALFSDPDESVQLSAVQAVQRIPDLRAVRPIIAILHRTQNAALKLQSVNALATCGSQKAVAILSALLPNADTELKKAIAKALCENGSSEAVETLVTLLDVDDLSIVAMALIGLKKSPVPSTIPNLISLSAHSNIRVRRHAVEALVETGTDAAFDILEQRLVNDSSPEVRTAAAKGLGRVSGQRSIQLLERALRDESAVRCAAVVSLVKIGDESVIPALLASLKDTVPEVRYHAVAGLGKLKADKAVRVIRGMLEDDSDLVRMGAEKALQNLGYRDASSTLSRRLVKSVSRLLPDRVAGVMPAAPVLAALSLAVAVMLLGWIFVARSNAGTENAMALAKAGAVQQARWMPGENAVILLRQAGAADIWDASTGSFKSKVDTPKIEEIASLSSLYLKRGKSLVAWTPDGPKPGDRPIKLPPSNLFEFSANASVAVYVTRENRTAMWDTIQGKPLEDLTLAAIPTPVLNFDGSVVAGADGDGKIVLVDRLSGNRIGESGEAGSVVARDDGMFLRMMFSSTGNSLAVFRHDRLVVCNLSNGTLSVSRINEKVNSSQACFPDPTAIYSTVGTSVTRLDLKTYDVSKWLITNRQVTINSWSLSEDQSLAVASADGKKLGWVINLADGDTHELSPSVCPAE